jgi:thiosulfate/3-mercaptopyruvate sulfurtransferase
MEIQRKVLFALPVFIIFASLLLGDSAFASDWSRTIPAIVSTDWLEKNLGSPTLVIVDIRNPAVYGSGHIPGSINEAFVTGFDPCAGPISHWVTGTKWRGTEACLRLEVPDISDLNLTIQNLGIEANSMVVIVSDPDPANPAPYYGLSDATRAAFTLIYAGISDVAILDGGYSKWHTEGRQTTHGDSPHVVPGTYEGAANREMIVSVEYVQRNLSKIIIDARDADVYYGERIELNTPRKGHIPSARCLPAPWIWECHANEDGTCAYYTYKDTEILRQMASGAIRGPQGNLDQEIIVYCGIGGYGSAWWFVLTQVLGYKNVRLYDGAIQEWGPGFLDYPMVAYQWE